MARTTVRSRLLRAVTLVLAVALLVAAGSGLVLAGKKKGGGGGGKVDPTWYDPDCIKECFGKQKDCNFTCAQISDEGENKACVGDCTGKYVKCAKACPPRRT